MDKIKVAVFRALLVGMLGLSWPLAALAASSSAQGWEEQAWRAGFLGAHPRLLLVADLEDDKGRRVRVMTMRGFAGSTVDGVFIAPIDEQGLVSGDNFRAYTQTATASRILDGQDMRDLPGDAFSSQHWWMEQGPATSLAQWWSMVLAVPQVPRSGGCRFSSHDHANGSQRVWLPSACTMKDPVTGRKVKLQWSGWRTASEDPQGWQMWVPEKSRVQVEGRVYTIQVRKLQLRTAYGDDASWPMSIVPAAFSGMIPTHAPLQEMQVPVEDLDYRQWQAR